MAEQRIIAHFQYSDVLYWTTSQEGLFMKPPLNMPLKPSVRIPWHSDENDQIRDHRVTILACVTLVTVPDTNLLFF